LALSEVGAAISLAFAKRHQDLIEFGLLTPYGSTGFDDFHSRARASLGSAKFNRLLKEMESIVPECEVLVGGFDLMGVAHLLSQRPNSAYECLDDPGFWAIGSGQQEAVSCLLFQADKLGFGIINDEGRCIYHLLAAKFTAESSRHVGQETLVVINRFNQRPRYLGRDAIDYIRGVWEEHSIPKLPKDLIAEIPTMIITDEG
jgi:hypothetical protein